MKRTLISFTILAIAAFTLIGCDDDESYVTVEGSLGLDRGAGPMGFEFDVPTPLASTVEQATPDCAAGGCVIHLGDDCQPDSFELWIDRGVAGDQELGFQTFELSISEGGATVLAKVASTDGEVSYSSSGSAECLVSDLSMIDASGDAVVDIDCVLAADPDLTAHATAHLVISGCTVE